MGKMIEKIKITDKQYERIRVIQYSEQKEGFAPYKGENPIVLKIIARKEEMSTWVFQRWSRYRRQI